MSDKLYRAKRSESRCEVTVNGGPLTAAEPIRVAGELLPVAEFAWGDDSEGSKYLAYCILHDFAPDLAKPLFPRLYRDFISQITDDEWTLTEAELREGIAFWTETMRIVQPHRPGEEFPRITIPGFIYRAFVKSVKFPGQTIAPKDVEQAIRKAGTRSSARASTVEYVDPASLAPLLRAAK